MWFLAAKASKRRGLLSTGITLHDGSGFTTLSKTLNLHLLFPTYLKNCPFHHLLFLFLKLYGIFPDCIMNMCLSPVDMCAKAVQSDKILVESMHQQERGLQQGLKVFVFTLAVGNE